MILKYLEFYRNLYYTNFESLSDSEIWLASLTAKNFTELDEMLSHVLNDRERNKLVSESIRMSKWTFSLHEWNKEKMDELVKDEGERIDRENREKALKEGRAEGREKNTIEIIENMLKKGIDENLISEITNKSNEEIKRIANSIK